MKSETAGLTMPIRLPLIILSVQPLSCRITFLSRSLRLKAAVKSDQKSRGEVNDINTIVN